MAVIDAVTLAAATRNFRAIFFAALEAAADTALLQKLAMVIPSTKPIESYRWLGATPQMVEWIGERVLAGLAKKGFEIENKKWANGIIVGADEIEDDETGQVTPRIQNLAGEAAYHKIDLIVTLLKGGFTGLAYDGKAFFSTTHAFGSNKLTAGLSEASYAEGRVLLHKIKNDRGRKLKNRTTHLFYGPSNEKTALQIAKAKIISSTENVWEGSVEPVMLHDLDNEWALADLSKPLKPFISQEKRRVQFRARDNPNDSNVFDKDEFKYGADYRGNAGYGLPELIVASDGTT